MCRWYMDDVWLMCGWDVAGVWMVYVWCVVWCVDGMWLV